MSNSYRTVHSTLNCELRVTTPRADMAGRVVTTFAVGNACADFASLPAGGGISNASPEEVVNAFTDFFGSHPNAHIQGSNWIAEHDPALGGMINAALARLEAQDVDGMAALSGMTAPQTVVNPAQ